MISSTFLLIGIAFAAGWLVGIICSGPGGDDALWRNLWRRQRHLYEMGPAAAHLEQLAIDREAKELDELAEAERKHKAADFTSEDGR